ncbi:MAG: hypothetical protein QOH56_2208, partial [Pseudonocardiales bacterium]|nr:hypothetical protein [Pseudonocardiales bacterium]
MVKIEVATTVIRARNERRRHQLAGLVRSAAIDGQSVARTAHRLDRVA